MDFTKPIYLKYEFENAVVRYDPETKSYFTKFKGEKEFISDIKTSNIVFEAVLDQEQITKEEYEKY